MMGIVGAGGAITGAIVSAIIAHSSSLRKERTRVMIEIEEYLDELWDISNALYHLKNREIACSGTKEEQAISKSLGRCLDRFYSIWDSRKRIIELNVYFKDPNSSHIYREIERLYEKSKNKIESLSLDPIIDNNKLTGDLLDLENEIIVLQNELSSGLRLHLSLLYILTPTLARWCHKVKERLKKPNDKSKNTRTVGCGGGKANKSRERNQGRRRPRDTIYY